jgi:hypothetical protein
MSFSVSNISSNNITSVSLSGSNGIASIDSGGIYYSNNLGANWTQSPSIIGNFDSVFLSGSNGIAGSSSFDGLYYSTDSGVNWTQSDITSGNFYTVALSGTNAIAASSFDDIGIYYSTNSGSGFSTWTQSNLTTGDFYSVFLSGANGVAGSGTDNDGIYYTTNSGVTWTKSSLATGNFVVALSGSIAVATSSDWFATGTGTGIYKSLDYGQNWTGAGLNSGAFNSLSLSGSRAIAGGSTNNGIYYASSPLCYEKNTLVLILENKVEVYKKICELKVGDIVKAQLLNYPTSVQEKNVPFVLLQNNPNERYVANSSLFTVQNQVIKTLAMDYQSDKSAHHIVHVNYAGEY